MVRHYTTRILYWHRVSHHQYQVPGSVTHLEHHTTRDSFNSYIQLLIWFHLWLLTSIPMSPTYVFIYVYSTSNEVQRGRIVIFFVVIMQWYWVAFLYGCIKFLVSGCRCHLCRLQRIDLLSSCGLLCYENPCSGSPVQGALHCQGWYWWWLTLLSVSSKSSGVASTT